MNVQDAINLIVVLLASLWGSELPGRGVNTGYLWTTYFGRTAPGFCNWHPGEGWDKRFSSPSDGEISEPFATGNVGLEITGGGEVYAAETGVVVWAGYSPFGGGYQVVLSHGRGWRTVYARLDEVSVSCGDLVKQGGVIGSGDRFYFSLERGRYSRDPLPLLTE